MKKMSNSIENNKKGLVQFLASLKNKVKKQGEVLKEFSIPLPKQPMCQSKVWRPGEDCVPYA